jgi:hypothetical protein
VSNPGYCPDCKESGWACRCGRESLPKAQGGDADWLRVFADAYKDDISEISRNKLLEIADRLANKEQE